MQKPTLEVIKAIIRLTKRDIFSTVLEMEAIR